MEFHGRDRPHSQPPDYDSQYRDLDSPLMRQIRREAYGEDIGQHSWVTAEELRADVARLGLTSHSRLLDLGCGPGGPLLHVLSWAGCRGTGIDASAAALSAARARAAALGVQGQATLRAGDLNEPLPAADGSFDAALSLDVVLHLPDRLPLFREVARILVPGGRFLFTDAGVITGAISSDEVAERSFHGPTQFVAAGFNEMLLERAGLRLLASEDRTSGLLRNAGGRLAARLAHREELERLEGAAPFARQQRYLETVVRLARRQAVSRWMYVAEARAL